MSIPAVRKFWQKVEQDPVLGQQVATLLDDGPRGYVAAIVELAAAYGFIFTAIEYEEAAQEEAGALSDTEVETVVGPQGRAGWL